MAYLRRAKVGKFTYVYVMKSVRRKGKPYPMPTVLEYLGRADKIDPKRLTRACRYWGVTTKARKGSRRR